MSQTIYFLSGKSSNKKYRKEVSGQRYYNALGVGLEMDTGGQKLTPNCRHAVATIQR
ncbi:hypothetical protein [Sphingobacterium puteale]|uniref:hypothetical protein n=1 Tax=Sphingobacterium puteale TaxID=2420510 RepID=UPI003D98B0C9